MRVHERLVEIATVHLLLLFHALLELSLVSILLVRARFGIMVTMWSVKIRPKPGFSRSRARSAAGTGFGLRSMRNSGL